jgi:hypothetical protein
MEDRARKLTELASWASDACAVEAAADVRVNASGGVVRWDDIMDAVRILDREGRRSLSPLQTGTGEEDMGLLGPAGLHSRNRNDQGRPLKN